MNPLERSGDVFQLAGLIKAQDLSRRALNEIAAEVRPGMDEIAIVEIAVSHMQRMGSPRAWHRPVVRVGKNTIYKFNENQRVRSILQKDDIFFLDLGPNWVIDGVEYEGDIGETFTVGKSDDLDHLARTAASLYRKGCDHWKAERPKGRQLYEWLSGQARGEGFELKTDVDGHRLSEFSHRQYFNHGLWEIDFVPTEGRWILEIQLYDPKTGCGAFFEDLLI
ncbi:MAG: aminopeptidase P family protein [Deltaproteobacteria bacterium]|nr:aminopeptidase P family protein [Deltaproteobacteria bacterium]MBI3295760.1 aminopeptidase P family protein [Deltaproteobacteria bacterium]